MKNILIIGSGGREHTLAWKLSIDNNVHQVYCMPGNGGTEQIAINLEGDISNFQEIYKLVKQNNISMIIVGPEIPLENGIVDFFQKKNIKIFGPTKYASQLECSKLFARKFMDKNSIPQPKFFECSDFKTANIIKDKIGFPLVLKADGLAAGKGVIICVNNDDFEDGIKAMFEDKKFGNASNKISIEECLIGDELSIFAVCDGKDFKIIGNAQDHKRIFNDDKGPNTGGMGAYSPTKICDNELLDKVENKIIKPTLDGMSELGNPFVGFLYVGLMIVDGEPFVIEFNVRMGDPETQVVIPRIETSLYDIFEKCIDGKVEKIDIELNSKTLITVVLASNGYPEKYEVGQLIQMNNSNKLIFHAGTKCINGNYIVSGGRVINVIGSGDSLKEAIDLVYRDVENISFSNMYYRTDIGKKGL